MKRPTLWIFNLCFCCSVTNFSVGFPRVLLSTHVQSSVVGLFFVAVPLPRLPGIDTKWHQVIIHNLDYLKPSGDKNWRLLQKLLIDLRDLDCVWICASCLWSFRNLSLWMFLLCFLYGWWGGGRPRLASNLDELNIWVISSLLILACFLFQLCLYPS